MKSLIPFIRLMFKEWLWLSLGALLGLITLCAGIGLLSLSGWFIAAAGFAGLSAASVVAFNYLLPSGGVRLFSMLRIAGRYGERVFSHEATFKILTRLRVWVYQGLEPLAPAHLLRFQSGDLLNRLVSDVDAMDNLYIRVLTPVLLALVVFVLLWFFLHFVNVHLAWIVFLSLVFSGFVIPAIAAVLGKKSGEKIQQMISQLRLTFVEYFQHMMELMIFAADKKQLEKVMACSDELIQLQKKMAMIKGLAIGLISLSAGVTIWLVLLVGVKLVHAGSLSGAFLALFTLAILAGFEAILPIPLAFQYLGKTITAAKRLLAIANTKPYVDFVSVSKKTINTPTIRFKEVSFSYSNNRSVLTNFNLTMKAGEKLGIMGPTGAGKTTLVHLLTRSWDPQAGEITIDGVNLRDLSESDLRDSMTVISQRPYLFNATLRDNLLLAKPGANDDELINALQKVQLMGFVANLPDGLDTFAGEGGVRFSGGQIRRIALARALLHDAPIWVLDEPTEGLDVATRLSLLEELHSLMKGKTALIISHREADLAWVDRRLSLPA